MEGFSGSDSDKFLSVKAVRRQTRGVSDQALSEIIGKWEIHEWTPLSKVILFI